MKKMKIILFCLMVMGLILGCGSGDSNYNRNTPDEIILLGEISNPPVLDEDETIVMIVNDKTVIIKNVNNEYYLLTDIGDRMQLPYDAEKNFLEKFNDKTFCIKAINNSSTHEVLYFYDGSQWKKMQFAVDYIIFAKVNDYGFIAIYESTQDGYISTLYIYDETNNTWRAHSELQNKKLEGLFNRFEEITGIINFGESHLGDLWAYKKGEWVHIFGGLISYKPINENSYFFYDADDIYSLWYYKDKRWKKISGFENQPAIKLTENYVLLETTLWSYKDGDWGIYPPAAGKKFLRKKWKYIQDYVGKENWVERNNEWVPLPGLKKFMDSNTTKNAAVYVNDNTVILSNNGANNEFYDASFIKQEYLSVYEPIHGVLVINENAIIIYSQVSGQHILLEYDSDTGKWQEGVYSGTTNFAKLNEHSFHDLGKQEFWVYEDGEWKIKLSQYGYYQINPTSLLQESLVDAQDDIFYVYDGDKWDEIIRGSLVKLYNKNTIVVSDANNTNGVSVLYFDGKEWEIMYSFEDAVYREDTNYITTADGKLYYFIR